MQWLTGVHEDVMAIVLFAAGTQALAKRLYFSQVTLSDFTRPRQNLWDLFQSFELNQTHEGKLQFIGIKGVEHDHFIAAEAQMLDAVEHGLLVIKEIADDND